MYTTLGTWIQWNSLLGNLTGLETIWNGIEGKEEKSLEIVTEFLFKINILETYLNLKQSKTIFKTTLYFM